MDPAVLTDSYSPIGDITVASVGFVILLLVFVSYKEKNISFKIFISIVCMLIVSAWCNIGFHMLVTRGGGSAFVLIAVLRCVYHGLLFMMLHHFVVYICKITALDDEKARIYTGIAALLLFSSIAAEAAVTAAGNGPVIVDGKLSAHGHALFMVSYTLFLLLIAVLMFHIRHHLFRKVMLGFQGCIALSLLILILEQLMAQSSFTTVTFLLPVISMLYLMHSYPYDIRMGSNNLQAMNSYIRYSNEHGKPCIFMSLYMHELDGNDMRLSDQIQGTVRKFTETYFRSPMLFRISGGHLLLMFRKNRNPDYEHRIEQILAAFRKEYRHFGFDYKIVIGQTNPELSRENEYVSFIRSIHAHIPENTVYRVMQDDVVRFHQYESILKMLEDIFRTEDLDDPRVLVYCQPVYHLSNGEYDTAEALMRLKMPDGSIVLPDRFIPLAESNGYIHTLTRIILNKTCRAIRSLAEEGYQINRISVNVSALELRDPGFCGDIESIIDRNGLEGSRIAIELTESRNESDFLLMKERISQLKGRGITFYLDDFGTGYSNMERILELPFDIIKFDRSMVVAGSQNKRSEQVLSSLAGMFSSLEYSVLYEGVENERDEKMCRNLSASYLQGFRYSRPVPVAELKQFLSAGP